MFQLHLSNFGGALDKSVVPTMFTPKQLWGYAPVMEVIQSKGCISLLPFDLVGSLCRVGGLWRRKNDMCQTSCAL